MRNHKEVVEYLHALELKYPVHQWHVNGVYFWPLLKVKLFFMWFESQAKDKAAIVESVGTKASKTGELIRSLGAWLLYLTRPVRGSKLVFTAAVSHRADWRGTSMNKFFDPIRELMNGKEGAVPWLLEYAGKRKPNSYFPETTLYLRELYPLVNVFAKLFLTRTYVVHSSPELNALLADVESFTGIASKKVHSQLNYSIRSIRVWELLYGMLLDRIKPAYAMSLCYYTLPCYGMYLAASKRGISTVEMQHGPQDYWHVAYGFFSRHPGFGYAFLPNVFWCWDEGTASMLKQWTDKQAFYRIVVGGNPWLESIRRKTAGSGNSDRSKVIVLYTLQPLEPLIETFVLDAIRRSPDDIEFWLRLHPRQFHQREQLLALVDEAGVKEKVNIDDASQLTLPEVLLRSGVHISKSSGAIIEAGLLGIPSVIIDPLGELAFQTEVDAGRSVVFLESDSVKFLTLIQTLAVSSQQAATVRVSFEECLDTNFLR